MNLKTLVALLLIGSALLGCQRLDPNSPEAKRQAVFKEMLKTSENMGGMLRGRLYFDAEKFRSDALKLKELSAKPWEFFPQPTPKEQDNKTLAKSEIWQRQVEFQAEIKKLEQAVQALDANTRRTTPTREGVRQDFSAVESACEGCHKKFRAL